MTDQSDQPSTPPKRIDSVLDSHPRFVWGCAAALILAGMVIRLQGITTENLWFDEILQSRITRKPLAWMWFHLMHFENDMPLDHTIQHFFIRWGGDTPLWIRMPAAIWGTLTLPVLFVWVRSALGGRTAIIALGLLATSPFHVAYSQEGRPYALFVLVTTLACWSLWEITQRRERLVGWWVLHVLSVAAMVITHFLTPLILASTLAWLWSWAILAALIQSRRQGKLLWTAIGATAVACLSALALMINFTRVSGTAHSASPIPFDGLSFVDTTKLVGTFLFGQSIGAQPIISTVFLLPLAIVGTVWIAARRLSLFFFLGLIWLGAIGGMIALCAVTNHWFSERYSIGALVPTIIALAAGIDAVVNLLLRVGPRRSRPMIETIVVLCLLLGGGTAATIWMKSNPHIKSDWRGFTEWLATQEGPPNRVLVDHAWALIRLDHWMERSGAPQITEVCEPVRMRERAAELGGAHLLFAQKKPPAFWGVPQPAVRFAGLTHWWARDAAEVMRRSPNLLAHAEEQFREDDQRLDLGSDWFSIVGTGWGQAENFNDEIPFRWSVNREANLVIPLDTPADWWINWDALAFEFSNSPPLRAAVEVNGIEVGQGIIANGWHTHSVFVSEEVWRPGVNEVRFITDFPVAPIELGVNEDRRPLAMALSQLELSDTPVAAPEQTFSPADEEFSPVRRFWPESL